jgi:hypothetical protein
MYFYITVDFAIAPSQNGVCLNQQMSHMMILFHNCSLMNDKSNQQFCVCFHVLNNIGFLMKGKFIKIKSVFIK